MLFNSTEAGSSLHVHTIMQREESAAPWLTSSPNPRTNKQCLNTSKGSWLETLFKMEPLVKAENCTMMLQISATPNDVRKKKSV